MTVRPGFVQKTGLAEEISALDPFCMGKVPF